MRHCRLLLLLFSSSSWWSSDAKANKSSARHAIRTAGNESINHRQLICRPEESINAMAPSQCHLEANQCRWSHNATGRQIDLCVLHMALLVVCQQLQAKSYCWLHLTRRAKPSKARTANQPSSSILIHQWALVYRPSICMAFGRKFARQDLHSGV